MNGQALVYFSTRVEGFHWWSKAPDHVAFLRHRHRHLFGVRVDLVVSHDDRDVEFITGKRLLEDYLRSAPIDGPESCEMIARRVHRHFSALGYHVRRVEVDEDGENGAYIKWGADE